MSTSTTPAPAKGNGLLAQAAAKQVGVEIPLIQLAPSPTNPRRTFREAYLKDLAGTIEKHGVLQDITIRQRKATMEDVKRARAAGLTPAFAPGEDHYEIVIGECRARSSAIAKKETIPAKIRTLSDEEVLEIQVIENQQRKDVHPLEEGLGYRSLMKLNKEKYTPEAIGERVGKSVSYIYGRMQLAELIQPIQDALLAEKINASHATEICRLQPKQQEQVFLECFGSTHRREYSTLNAVAKDKNAEAGISVRDLRHYIQDKVLLDLSKAPFDTKDATLLPAAGACSNCPKRAGSNPSLFGDIARGDTCTDPGCYEEKKQALVQIKIAEVQKATAAPSPELTKLERQLEDKRFLQNAPPATVTKVKAKVEKLKDEQATKMAKAPVIQVQKISEEYRYYGDKKRPGVLERNDFTLAKPGCSDTKKAIFVDGPKVGQLTEICTKEKCNNHGYTHSREPGTPLSLEEKRKRLKQQRDNKLDQAYRTALTAAVRSGVKALNVHDLRDIALEMVHLMDRRYRNPIFAAMGWKTTQSFYGPSIPEKNIAALKPADLAAFLALITVASHVLPGCESYWPDTDVDLGPLAKRHKINLAKIKTEAEAPLRKKFAEIDERKKASTKKVKPKKKK